MKTLFIVWGSLIGLVYALLAFVRFCAVRYSEGRGALRSIGLGLVWPEVFIRPWWRRARRRARCSS